jgi:hypothetical protein
MKRKERVPFDEGGDDEQTDGTGRLCNPRRVHAIPQCS